MVEITIGAEVGSKIERHSESFPSLPEHADFEPPRSRTHDAITAAVRIGVNLIPGVGSALLEAADAIEGRKLDRQLRYLRDVSDFTRERQEQLAQGLETDDGIQELFIRGFQLSGEARSSQKIKLLAAVVANALDDERSGITTGHVMLTVLESLEPVHIDVMVQVDHLAKPHAPGDTEPSKAKNGTTPDVLAKELSIPVDVIQILITDLENRHLVTNIWEGTYNGFDLDDAAFSLTPLGKEAIRLLLDIHGGLEQYEAPPG